MIQICAKIGGSPWGLWGLPLCEIPTMIIGIDVAHNVGKNKDSIVGFAASLDKFISWYYIDSIIKPKKIGDSKFKPQNMTFELEPLF